MSALKIFKFVFMIIVLLWLCYVAVANRDPITLRLLPSFSGDVTLPPIPLSVIIFCSFLLGVFIAGFYGVLEVIKQGRKVRKLSKQKNLLDKEITNLREEPLVVEDRERNPSPYKNSSYSDMDPPMDEETLNKIR